MLQMVLPRGVGIVVPPFPGNQRNPGGPIRVDEKRTAEMGPTNAPTRMPHKFSRRRGSFDRVMWDVGTTMTPAAGRDGTACMHIRRRRGQRG
jgi:hypothetical protein